MADKYPWGKNVEGVTPGSVKNISSQKMKAFNIGSMNVRKGMTKKEQDEMKKKEQEDAAKVYEEFVESFEDTGKSINRAWVKGGVVNPDKEKAERAASSGRFYKPMTKLAEQTLSKSSERSGGSSSKSAIDKAKLKKGGEKKKSNLELFKEELQRIQEERQERRRVKSGEAPASAQDVQAVQEPSRKSRFDPVPEPPALGASLGIGLEDTLGAKGSYTYSDDNATTNLYLGNINPKMSEPSLCELFGKFGPLASVKIMWPRSEEERSRGRNCGFVAYMNRNDGERALAALQGKDIDGFEMKLGWGKAVPIPPHPVYVPPALAELTLPPPPSGLPFNCQPTGRNRQNRYPHPPLPDRPDHEHREYNKILSSAVVKVVIPTERIMLQLIHRVIEFVVREGPMFEAMIMNKEMTNPQFRFLFENQSPAHVYYRWKLFSILQGDSVYAWRTQPFNMFAGGSVWQPPPMDPYTQGMPDELLGGGGAGDGRLDGDNRRGQLSESQRDRLEDMLRELTPERIKIGDSMVWCLEHAESAEEIVECLSESLSLMETPLAKKIARLYLVSDILHNCSAKVPHASYYRKYFEVKLKEIFKDMRNYYEKISGRLKAEQFKNRVMGCFRAWEDWAVYPNDLLIKLQNIFLGLVSTVEDSNEEEDGAVAEVDGAPLDVDGMPLDVDGEPLGPKEVDLDGMPLADVDGMPLSDAMDSSEPVEDPAAAAPKFLRSKWETVDESELEAQAVTTSKWEALDAGEEAGSPEEEEETEQDVDGAPMNIDDDEDGESMDSAGRLDSALDETSQERPITEEKRAKLREIEMKVMKYNDELELGKRTRKPDMTLQGQLAYYRNKLLNKELEKEKDKIRDKEREKRRKDEEVRIREWERARAKERERERERELREKERATKQARESSHSERSSDSSSRRNERNNRRRGREDSSPDPSPARGGLGMVQGYGGRSSTSRSPSPAPSSTRSRGGRQRSSPSPPQHRGNNYTDSPATLTKSRVRSRSPVSRRGTTARRTRSRSPRHKHKKHKNNRH